MCHEKADKKHTHQNQDKPMTKPLKQHNFSQFNDKQYERIERSQYKRNPEKTYFGPLHTFQVSVEDLTRYS